MRSHYCFIFTLMMTVGAGANSATAQSDLSSPVMPVHQLQPVQATDWAFSALQTLQNKYQCLQGYPEQTLRGESSVTRYEFAAMMKHCLQTLDHPVEMAHEIQQLKRQFPQELAILRGRVDGITARTRELELTTFSPTTKLRGTVNFVISDFLQAAEETAPIFQARSRLNFNTSFTGQDQLLTRLTVGNSKIPSLAEGTPEITQTHQWEGDTDNEVVLSQLSYQFPISETASLQITAQGGEPRDDNLPPINPFLEDDNAGTTTLSTLGQGNPILTLGGGTGVAFSQSLTPNLDFGAGYYSQQADQGLFGDAYSTGLHLQWDATDDLAVRVNYWHNSFEKGKFGFRDGLQQPAMGTAVVNETLAQFPTVTNSYGLEAFWQPHSQLGLGGWLGYTHAQAMNHREGEIWNYALSAVFPDLGKNNNLGGIIIGAQPYLGHFGTNAEFNNQIPWQLEAFYRWQVSDQLSLTPGIIWYINPNQDPDQADIVSSSLRMTFTF